MRPIPSTDSHSITRWPTRAPLCLGLSLLSVLIALPEAFAQAKPQRSETGLVPVKPVAVLEGGTQKNDPRVVPAANLAVRRRRLSPLSYSLNASSGVNAYDSLTGRNEVTTSQASFGLTLKQGRVIASVNLQASTLPGAAVLNEANVGLRPSKTSSVLLGRKTPMGVNVYGTGANTLPLIGFGPSDGLWAGGEFGGAESDASATFSLGVVNTLGTEPAMLIFDEDEWAEQGKGAGTAALALRLWVFDLAGAVAHEPEKLMRPVATDASDALAKEKEVRGAVTLWEASLGISAEGFSVGGFVSQMDEQRTYDDKPKSTLSKTAGANSVENSNGNSGEGQSSATSIGSPASGDASDPLPHYVRSVRGVGVKIGSNILGPAGVFPYQGALFAKGGFDAATYARVDTEVYTASAALGYEMRNFETSVTWSALASDKDFFKSTDSSGKTVKVRDAQRVTVGVSVSFEGR